MQLDIKKNVPLAQYTTLQVGGVADYVVEVTSVEEVQVACEFAQQTHTPLLILGGGSNVLISDQQLHRLVIINKITGVTCVPCDNHVLVTAGAGENWDSFVESLINQGLGGLENLSGIPGTVGAAPVQNINAYGASVADSIEQVEVYDVATNTLRTLSSSECDFGYRDSIFKKSQGKQLIVVSVTFKVAAMAAANLSYRSASQSIERYLLEKNISSPTVADVRQAVLYVRSNIGMLLGQFRSAGSFFKNTVVSAEKFTRIEEVVKKDFAEINERLSPWHWRLPNGEEKIATAFLLECSPYNKNTYGNKRWNDVVGISPKHSLSVITFDGATATDVHEFVKEIKESVKNIFGVVLETEVDFIL